MNTSKTKVMRCAQDGVPKEAAVDPCSVCGQRMDVNSIHRTTRAMFKSARKFGESGIGFCVHNV